MSMSRIFNMTGKRIKMAKSLVRLKNSNRDPITCKKAMINPNTVE